MSNNPDPANRAASATGSNKTRVRLIGGAIAAVAAAAITAVILLGTANGEATPQTTDGPEQIKLGVGEVTPVWDTFKEVALRDHNVDVELVPFSDWTLPNTALVNGEIDANAFQHVLFLSQFNVANNATLQPVGVTSLGTLGLYSEGAATLDDIPAESTVLVPNDPTNQGRALLLLDRLGLIELTADTGLFASTDDIAENPHRFEFVPLAAQQIASSLGDAGAGVVYQSQAVKAGLPADSVLATDLDLVHEPEYLPYQAVFAARAEDAGRPVWKKLEATYHSEEVVAAYHKENEGRGVISQAELPELLDAQKQTEARLKEEAAS